MEWDLTASVWGNSTSVMRVRDEGQEIDLIGHHPQAHRFNIGDTLILRGSRGGTTRYLLEKFERFRDPPDMWKGTASFFPREVERAGE